MWIFHHHSNIFDYLTKLSVCRLYSNHTHTCLALSCHVCCWYVLLRSRIYSIPFFARHIYSTIQNNIKTLLTLLRGKKKNTNRLTTSSFSTFNLVWGSSESRRLPLPFRFALTPPAVVVTRNCWPLTGLGLDCWLSDGAACCCETRWRASRSCCK